MRLFAFALLLTSGIAVAGPRPIHTLPTTDYTYELKAHNVDIKAFRVVAATPVLTAKINALIADTAGIYGAAKTYESRELGCYAGLVTDAFVSWYCGGLTYGDSGGTAMVSTAAALFIDKDDVRRATLADLFVPDFAKRAGALTGKDRSDSPCKPDLAFPFAVLDEGVAFMSAEERCTLGWDVLKPLSAKGSIVRRIIDEDDDEEIAPLDDPKAGWAKAQPRFVIDGDAVHDRATGLMWATRDNGADIDHAGAIAFADAFESLRFDDWRLPTEEELEELSDVSMAHRDKSDCTKGKNALLLTPLIKLSCGLAWTTSTSYPAKRPIAFGFISGTPRAAKPTEKKNFRALVVRER